MLLDVPGVTAAEFFKLLDFYQEVLLDFCLPAYVYQFVGCSGEAFLRHEEFLVQLLAGSEAGVLYSDVAVRGVARQQYHIPGKVRDLHRLAHVQNENFAFVGVGSRLEHQGNGLRYRHEKSRDFRVGHRHRTACSDLLFEKGHDAAVASKHVAETDCCEYGVFIFIVHGLHDHLAEALRCSHDVGGVHCFVGADKHEPADPCIPCRHGGFISAEDIVLDCLVRGLFHKGHVLVGRCVVDDVRLIFRHNLPDASAVSDGADQGFQVKLGEVPPEFLLDVVDVVFVYIEDYEFSWSV